MRQCHCLHLLKARLFPWWRLLGSSVLIMTRGVLSVWMMGSAGVYRAATQRVRGGGLVWGVKRKPRGEKGLSSMRKFSFEQNYQVNKGRLWYNLHINIGREYKKKKISLSISAKGSRRIAAACSLKTTKDTVLNSHSLSWNILSDDIQHTGTVECENCD